MAEENKPAEVRCTCSHSTLTSWWWIMGWLGMMAYYLTTASWESITPDAMFGLALLIAAALCYFFWPVLILIELAEAVMLLRAIAAALEVSV